MSKAFFVEQAISNLDSCPRQPHRNAIASSWKSVLEFGGWVLIIGFALSVIALVWIDFSWWTIFRRCVSIAAVLSLWLCAEPTKRRLSGTYGLASFREGKRHLLLGLGLGFSVLVIMGSLGLVSGACRIAVTPDRSKLWSALLSFIPGALLVSVIEECVFR